jgi:hypothetical protein
LAETAYVWSQEDIQRLQIRPSGEEQDGRQRRRKARSNQDHGGAQQDQNVDPDNEWCWHARCRVAARRANHLADSTAESIDGPNFCWFLCQRSGKPGMCVLRKEQDRLKGSYDYD